jgi:hypothetical protein
MVTYAETVAEFYNGEVLGETVYSALLSTCQNDEQRLKLATLLQLETETKAWLRPHALKAGVSIEERAADREEGARLAGQLKALPWATLWRVLHDALSKQVLPRFRILEEEARARGEAHEEALCRYMIEHEESQIEFARREIEGADVTTCLEPVVRHLKYRFAA